MRTFNLALKRIVDIFGSLVGLVILLPLMIIIAILIKLTSEGPVIFKQERLGKNGRVFKIYKFRTMVVNAENIGDGLTVKSESDSRITKVGRILRKTSLDELPQLFNVLVGHMSLVGPRPEIPDVVKFYPEEYKQRLLVLPGITGLAQISGRGEIELGKTIYYDLTYIKNFSILYDIKILFKTVLSVFKREGAF